MESIIILPMREARNSERLRFQVSRALEVMDTSTVTMMLVMAMATINSMRVNPRRRVRWGAFMD